MSNERTRGRIVSGVLFPDRLAAQLAALLRSSGFQAWLDRSGVLLDAELTDLLALCDGIRRAREHAGANRTAEEIRHVEGNDFRNTGSGNADLLSFANMKLMNTKEAASRLGISDRHVGNLCLRANIERIRVGKARWLYRPADIEALRLERLESQ